MIFTVEVHTVHEKKKFLHIWAFNKIKVFYWNMYCIIVALVKSGSSGS